MSDYEKEEFIRRIANHNEDSVQGNKIIWSRHAITEAVKDGLSRLDVEIALKTCELIEDYPHISRTLPDCLVLG